jgi:hypothetical protein
MFSGLKMKFIAFFLLPLAEPCGKKEWDSWQT